MASALQLLDEAETERGLQMSVVGYNAAISATHHARHFAIV